MRLLSHCQHLSSICSLTSSTGSTHLDTGGHGALHAMSNQLEINVISSLCVPCSCKACYKVLVSSSQSNTLPQLTKIGLQTPLRCQSSQFCNVIRSTIEVQETLHVNEDLHQPAAGALKEHLCKSIFDTKASFHLILSVTSFLAEHDTWMTRLQVIVLTDQQ